MAAAVVTGAAEAMVAEVTAEEDMAVGMWVVDTWEAAAMRVVAMRWDTREVGTREVGTREVGTWEVGTWEAPISEERTWVVHTWVVHTWGAEVSEGMPVERCRAALSAVALLVGQCMDPRSEERVEEWRQAGDSEGMWAPGTRQAPRSRAIMR